MNKSDLKLIIGCLIVALIAGGIYLFVGMNHQAEYGVVEYKGNVILEFDLDKNDIYEFRGDYGIMHLEVKDGQYRVTDVECPNHTCEQMGWNSIDSIMPIVCLPNDVIVHTTTE